MPPPRPPLEPRLDPQGYYRRLGLTPEATRPAIVAAFRAKARLLHPDVPGTGDPAAFMAVKQAYDVLSDARQRGDYDQAAQRAAAIQRAAAAEAVVPPPVRPPPARPAPRPAEAPLARPPRLSDMPVPVWAGLGLLLGIGIYQVVSHLRAAVPPEEEPRIQATAAPVAPLSPAAHEALLYGPTPLHLPGAANFYVAPGAGAAVLYHLRPDHRTLVPVGQLPSFSTVHALRVYAQSDMMEIATGPDQSGFVQAQHLTPGNELAAHRAYCAYNAGPAPADGEILERGADGPSTLRVENHALQPAVVRLRLPTGATAAAVFLAPGGWTNLTGLPMGPLRPEYAVGELWSRACNGFAAGMRAWRLHVALHLPSGAPLVVTEDNAGAVGEDIPDDAFEKP